MHKATAQSSRQKLNEKCTNLPKPGGIKALHTPPFLTGRGDVCMGFVLSFVRSFVQRGLCKPSTSLVQVWHG